MHRLSAAGAVSCLLIALGAAAGGAGEEPPLPPAQGATKQAEPPEPAVPTIFYSCDIQGRLEPCTFEEGSLGGVARMATLYRKWADERPDHIIVDVGNATAKTHANKEAINALTLRALDALGYAVANCGDNEAALPPEAIERLAEGRKLRMISANLCRADDRKPLLPPYSIVEANGKRIAFIGLVRDDIPPERLGKGLALVSADGALRNSLDAVRDKVAFVVVLAYLRPEDIYKLARRHPRVDLFLGGRARCTSAPFEVAGRSLVSYLGDEGCTIARIDDACLPKGRPPSASGRVALLGPLVASDPRMADLVAAFREAAGGNPPGADWDPKMPGTSSFVGTEVCKLCHVKQFFSWRGASHAGAYAKLLEKGEQANPACLRCHATGYEMPGGFDPEKQLQGPKNQDALKGVGCESCHGGSRRHLGVALRDRLWAAKEPHLRPRVAFRNCVSCHSAERPCRAPGTRDPFELKDYTDRIKHWQGIEVPDTDF